ncbi:hypothetical protein [Amnibacterium kyonggiense]|uniref:Serine O-acetyltransferase n=1 Tax=Amnibacterium kyonggiense TaxID=595671 RepID=A0A4R7FHT0_9MICO|nr:hypothetical protein [Amnibacterium kyonggiense]TDS74897.1 hypothetical protein CLV52_3419 [Amnibacterium kyonggiense]
MTGLLADEDRSEPLLRRARRSFVATFGEPLTGRSLARALLDPGFRATMILAAQLWCARHGVKIAALWLRLHNVRAYGMDVEVGATIGSGLRIRHPRGIVIHHAARVGDGVAI